MCDKMKNFLSLEFWATSTKLNVSHLFFMSLLCRCPRHEFSLFLSWDILRLFQCFFNTSSSGTANFEGHLLQEDVHNIHPPTEFFSSLLCPLPSISCVHLLQSNIPRVLSVSLPFPPGEEAVQPGRAQSSSLPFSPEDGCWHSHTE